MYNRDAKAIGSQVWLDLMKPATWQEVLNIILSGETNKAAGIDGVNCDLIRLLVEDSETENEPTPLLKIIVSLINESLESGCTPRSWRKAIISMVPKRKEDGSYTSLIGEMRPISVLQEFGKVSSKLLSVRMGQIILEHPNIMNKAQRAFIRDGSTSQCITTALNILEDFQRKRKPESRLFLLAYDQVKAYDSVQAYTIRASLERFNLPEKFISYVLCNLENATSCFKTFFGPTSEFQVVTSVRQGDPLAPLIYICVMDALHEGLMAALESIFMVNGSDSGQDFITIA